MRQVVHGTPAPVGVCALGIGCCCGHTREYAPTASFLQIYTFFYTFHFSLFNFYFFRIFATEK